MSQHNAIVVSPSPQGHFIEGTLAAGQTPKPGQFLRLNEDGTYSVWNGEVDGERDELILVVEDHLQGKTLNDAYQGGSRFFAYIPLPGDEVQALFNYEADASTSVTAGDKLVIKSGTGKTAQAIVDPEAEPPIGPPEMEPLKALETIETMAADTLVLCRVTGC